MKLKALRKFLNEKISTIEFLKHYFIVRAAYDKKAYRYMKSKSRIYIYITYGANCVKTGKFQLWSSRKWYLSDHMTEDEIIKTCYTAFKAVIEHEVMESFRVDGKIIFNPHISYKELQKISHKEITRK